MITIKLMGGLGNQMFQYAFIKAQAERTNQEFALETGIYDKYRCKKMVKNLLKITVSIARPRALSQTIKEIRQNRRQYDLKYFQLDDNTKLIRSSRLPEIQEKIEFSFDSDIVLNRDNVSYKGYFNTEKYFSEIGETIRKNFQLKPEYLKNLPQGIGQEIDATNSVSVHIRRGDYVNSKNINAFHGTCGLDYYKKAINIIKEKIATPKFFIFSDDIEWCQKNLNFPEGPFFIAGLKNYQDLALMMKCKHHIIANSTFSWWGAWLSNNKEKIVIAPKKWLNKEIATPDILPSSWLKI